MKWVMYFLLLANAAFFAQQYHQMSNAPPPPLQAVSPYAHVNRLLLLSETKTEKLRVRQPLPKPPPPPAAAAEEPLAAAEEPPAVTVAPPSPAGIPNRKCYSIGPLDDDAQIAAMRTWLVAMGGNPVLRVDERRELERYWVYFPPAQSPEEALQKVERMRSEGIEDVIAVPKGDMTNAISLGVFSQRISLERRLQELKQLGYEPSIMPRYRTQEASWFDVSFEEGQGLDQSELSARFPDAELSDASCASAEIAGGGAGS